jgi:hypothetical protein
MLAAAEPGATDVVANPAVALGLVMGAAAQDGRDKLTPRRAAGARRLRLWIEQLIAESTGKNGAGIVPIAGEPPPIPQAMESIACSTGCASTARPAKPRGKRASVR